MITANGVKTIIKKNNKPKTFDARGRPPKSNYDFKADCAKWESAHPFSEGKPKIEMPKWLR